MTIKRFGAGDTLIMKKHHACGADAFAFLVLMAGSDVKVRCQSCGHEMIVPRVKLEKHIKKIENLKEEPQNV